MREISLFPELRSRSYHNFVRDWHPNASKFGKPCAVTRAEDAIREGDELRRKLAGKRVLEVA